MGRKKKVQTLVEEKEAIVEKETVAQLPVTDYLTYMISVTPTQNLPDPREYITQTKFVQGSFLRLPEVFEGEHSFLKPEEDKIWLCLVCLNELDKQNKGAFSDEYFIEGDKQTPELKQVSIFREHLTKVWRDITPLSDLVVAQQFGIHMRMYLRQIVFRLYCYYRLGYTVSFTPISK